MIDAAEELMGTPLLYAMRRSKRELRSAANSNADQKYLCTDICMILIDRGCDVNIPGSGGYTALHAAVELNHELVRKLLISGSEIYRGNICGFTPLYYACLNGNHRLVDLLIICGANLRAQAWETYLERWRCFQVLNGKNNQQLNYIIYKSKQCLSLKNLCNIIIRKNIRNIEKYAIQLGLPLLLVKLLQLKD